MSSFRKIVISVSWYHFVNSKYYETEGVNGNVIMIAKRLQKRLSNFSVYSAWGKYRVKEGTVRYEAKF